MPGTLDTSDRHVRVPTAGGLTEMDGPRFPIGSVTKLLTALLVLDVAEEGLLDLDAPIDGSGGPKPTPRELLTHRAMLPFELHPSHWGAMSLDRQALARAREHLPRIALPPLTWHYSNLGYAILAGAVEAATSLPYEIALRERVTAPLGMTSTSLPTPSEAAPVLGAAGAAGDLWSTCGDLHRLACAAEERTVAGKGRRIATRLLELLSPAASDRLAGPGFELRRLDAHWVLVSRGTIGSASCCLVVWPRRGASMLVSSRGTSSEELASAGIAAWRRPTTIRRWWLDGQEVVETTSGDDVDLVIAETLWPIPLFSGVRDGARLVGRAWTGAETSFRLHGDRLIGDGLVLSSEPSTSAHGAHR